MTVDTVRIIDCPDCHGEGEVPIEGYSLSPFSGVLVRDPQGTDYVRCDTCGGTGTIQEPAHSAWRSDARPRRIPFSELRVGDYMTAEDGDRARWVLVTAIRPSRTQVFHPDVGEFRPREDWLSITFWTPTIEGSGAGHQDWVIDRAPDAMVTIDQTARGAESAAS